MEPLEKDRRLLAVITPALGVEEMALFACAGDRHNQLADLKVSGGGRLAGEVAVMEADDEDVLGRKPFRALKGRELDGRSSGIESRVGRGDVGGLFPRLGFGEDPSPELVGYQVPERGAVRD